MILDGPWIFPRGSWMVPGYFPDDPGWSLDIVYLSWQFNQWLSAAAHSYTNPLAGEA